MKKKNYRIHVIAMHGFGLWGDVHIKFNLVNAKQMRMVAVNVRDELTTSVKMLRCTHCAGAMLSFFLVLEIDKKYRTIYFPTVRSSSQITRFAFSARLVE